jgi:2-oxoisovalerate dehydrogenase E1 component
LSLKKPIKTEQIIKWYRLAYTTRQVDDQAGRYIRRGMGWSYHARCGGHEGIQVALGSFFRPKIDFLFPYYRDTATVLAAGMTPYELMLNGLSKADDPASGGRHMSNHFAKPEIGIQNVSSCTGNHTLHAVGVARAIKYYGSNGIAFSSQGDSSVSEGYCYEAINGASREKLPVIFVIQNNGYGISVPVSEQTANACVADNFVGIKHLHIARVDGTDFFASFQTMGEAVDYVNSGKGPAMVHAQCVRMGAHSNSDAQELYREREEILKAQRIDPVLRLRRYILKETILTETDLVKLEKEIDAELQEAGQRAEAASVPSAQSVTQFIEAPRYEPAHRLEPENYSEAEKTEKLREAINRTLKEEFEKNPDTFLWGQDVASKEKGGVFNLTKGMLAKFGNKRVFNAPIAEDFIVGTANGMCRFDKKIHVVIEAAQFADYVWPAMEQIVEMSHDYWRSFGKFSPNVVFRLASGGYIQGGLYHSQNVEAIMSHLPGVRVVYPAFAEDAAGLLRTAIRSQGMTFFLEPKYLYNRAEAKGPNLGSEHAVPFGKGRVRHSGVELSIITYGNTVSMALLVAQKLKEEGHSIEVFDLRSIKPLDEEGIFQTVRRTGKVLVVHEDHRFNGIGSEVSSIIMEHCFADLDAPVMRVAALDVPVGFAKVLETTILPQVHTIENAVKKLLAF